MTTFYNYISITTSTITRISSSPFYCNCCCYYYCYFYCIVCVCF